MSLKLRSTAVMDTFRVQRVLCQSTDTPSTSFKTHHSLIDGQCGKLSPLAPSGDCSSNAKQWILHVSDLTQIFRWFMKWPLATALLRLLLAKIAF